MAYRQRRAMAAPRLVFSLGWAFTADTLFQGSAALAQPDANPIRAPKPLRSQVASSSKLSSIPVQVFDAYLRFFRTVISPVDGAMLECTKGGMVSIVESLKEQV